MSEEEPRTVIRPDSTAGSRRSKLVPTLSVLEGPDVGAFYPLEPQPGENTVGRGDEATVQIPAPSVSRCHAIFTVALRDGNLGVRVDDNRSTNGLLVNGTAVGQMWLVSGDKVRMGDVLIRFEWMSEDEVRYHTERADRIQAGNRDHLTGLLSRTFLDNRLQPLLAELDDREQTACCLMLDLDHFKRVNDQYGHPAGDEVLRRVAEVVQAGLRKTDYAVRYGGEELLLLMPDLGLDWGLEVADRLRRKVSALDLTHVHAELKVTVSIGLAVRQRRESGASWFKRADDALYGAKEQGRDRVVIADDPSRASTDPTIQGLETREIAAQPSPASAEKMNSEVDTSRLEDDSAAIDTVGLPEES